MTVEPKTMTLEEFLVWESTQDMKHEYYKGQVRLYNVVAMPGGSFAHNRIERNLVGVLFMAFQGSDCEVFTSNQTVMSAEQGVGFYPDATILVDPVVKQRYGGIDAMLNPAVVFEVSSSSTVDYDRNYKLDAYRAIPSMREVFLVSSSEWRVERHVRTVDGWESETYFEGEFPVLDRQIAFADIYDRTEVQPGNV